MNFVLIQTPIENLKKIASDVFYWFDGNAAQVQVSMLKLMLINKYLFVPGNNINFPLVLRNESTNVYSAKLFGIHRSICPEVFVVKEVFLKIIYRKYRCWGLFLRKLLAFSL